MTRRAFKRAYSHVRLWVREHGVWPAERDLGDSDRVALDCLYQREVAVMDWEELLAWRRIDGERGA